MTSSTSHLPKYQPLLKPWERGLVHLSCEVIRAGKILALETDTVPGLAVNAFNPEALDRLYRLKNREAQKPLVWMTHDIALLKDYIEISPLGQKLITEYWPGALTLVFPLTPLGKATLGVPLRSSTGEHSDTLALRIPNNDFLCACLATLQAPLAVTSANYSEYPETHSLKATRKVFGFKIDAYLERSHPMSGVTSTVAILQQDTLKILRKGSLTPHLLKKVASSN